MRRNLALLALLACAAAFGGCAERTTTPTNATTNANAANANGSSQGVGPHGQGVGGTGGGNGNATVAGNSNVEPTGVNRNVGATPAANRNR